ncbi:glycosyltransferase, partial [Okeania sp.]|uniref:glycosyltransferase n=1 Tax=Okeania sp. TaxID=3100323 RepID=UPI002B4AB2E4
CRIVGEHPEVEWIGGPQYVFETDVRQKVLQRGTPTPTAVIREGLCDGKHWEMLQQEGTFFSKALWLKSKHGLKGFELAGDWNFWREMADHGVYYQYESPLGAFRKRVGQLSVDRIGDYRAEIERILPLEVRKGRFEGVYREQEWGANLIKSDGVSGKMVVEVQSVREVYEKVREKLSVQGDRFGEVESSKAQSDETKETNTSSLILTKAQHSLRIIIMTHISMGYGSPEYLRLYTLLKRRGHEVLLIDHEEPPGGKRKYVPFPGVNRIRVKHSKTMTQEERALYYKGFYDSLSEFKGQILISGWTDFALRKVGDCPIQVLYFNEIEDEFGIKHREELEKEKPTCADAVISANEDRLEIAKGIHHKAKDFFIVYNAPLVSEFNELPRKLNTTDRYNVLYQGQLNPIAGIDILLELAENYSNKIFLHIAGPASDKYEKLLMNLHNSGKLHYHGFVTHEKLAELRSFCDVGLVTWREDLGQLPLSIKYCSPTKLYEYIASGLPVVFLPNYTLNLWNDRFSFGRGASEFSSDSLAEAIFNCCKSEEIFHSQSKHNINMFKSVLNYEFLSSAFVNWLENYAEKNLDPNEAFSQK